MTPVAIIGSMQLDWRFLLSFSASIVLMTSTLFIKSCLGLIGARAYCSYVVRSKSLRLGMFSSLIYIAISFIVRLTMNKLKLIEYYLQCESRGASSGLYLLTKYTLSPSWRTLAILFSEIYAGVLTSLGTTYFAGGAATL